MYMPFLMAGYAIAVVLMIVACRVTSRSLPGLTGVGVLAWALASALAGALLLAARPIAPQWVAILLAYQGLFGFSLLYYVAVAQCLAVTTRIAQWGSPLLALGLAADAYFTYARPSLAARFLVGSLIQAAFAAVAAQLLFSSRTATGIPVSRQSTRRYAIGALAWLQVLVVAYNLVHCALTLIFPPADALRLDHIQAAYTYLNLILTLASGAGLIGVAFWIHRDELYSHANTDGLTGLLNRRAFDEILIRELLRANVAGRPLPVMMADVDFFKRVNDTLGHQAGDEVLRQVGRALHKALRPADVLCRFGGEEFAILLRETRIRPAAEVAERLRTGVASLSKLPGGIRLTISIGLAASLPGENPQELIARCDRALYRSKREGRNRVSVAPDGPVAEPALTPPSPRHVSDKEQQSA